MILQVFNKYLEQGGEEKSVDRIFTHALSAGFDLERCFFDSADWKGRNRPSPLQQLAKLFYNKDSVDTLNQQISKNQPEFLLFHNIYPVGSPALYKAAIDSNIPVIQYIHNFRPFSVGATLWDGTRITEESLRGSYMSEIRSGTWQGSVIKSALFALLLKKLHYQGWLDSVKHWIAISDFMRDKFILAGISPDKITTLRHSWDAMVEAPEHRDKGYYLLMARLVPEKGVQTALDTWKLLETEMGDHCPVLYVAGSGSEESAVKAAAEKTDKINFIGYVDGHKKGQLIKHCKAMLAPSLWWEPLGIVTYEAYDYGKPMLAAASGGLTETVIDGVTGYLHDPGDPFSLLLSVSKLEALPDDQRHDMGMNGREWLLKNASAEKWRTSFSEIINKVKKGI